MTRREKRRERERERGEKNEGNEKTKISLIAYFCTCTMKNINKKIMYTIFEVAGVLELLHMYSIPQLTYIHVHLSI